MADVFISYSRRDLAYVERLRTALAARGKDVWLDTDGIADGEVFPEAIKRAIEQSDVFLFVITPSSVHSTYCENEVEHARELQKRIMPVLREPVADSELPAQIRDRNWVPFIDDADFEPGMARLLRALDSDLDAAKAHTRWLVKALEWDAEGRDKSFLLRGSELKAAETWLASRSPDSDPAPTQLQREYLLASREAAVGRQRALTAASVAVAAVSIGLLIFALISRGQAITAGAQAVSERIGARSQALAAESQAQLPNDPEISLILGMRAVQTRATPQSVFALRAALDASPLELALPTFANPGSCASNSGLSAAVRPGGGQIAEAACSGRLRLLDPTTGRVLRDERIAAQLSGVAYSPSGAILAVGTDRGVALVDPATGAVTARSASVPPAGASGIDTIAFSPDGHTLAADDQNGVTLFTVPGLHPRALVRNANLGGRMVFSRAGRLLIVGGVDAAVHIYNVASGRQVHRIAAPQQGSEEGSWPEVVAMSPDGSRLAVGYPTVDYNVIDATLYSTNGWRREFTVFTTTNAEISALAFSPDGTRLAIGLENGSAGVWSLVTREQLANYIGATAAVTAIDFLSGGRAALTVGNDGIGRIWRGLGAEQALAPVSGTVIALGLGGARLTILRGDTGRAYVSTFALPSGAPLQDWDIGPYNNDALSPNGRFVLTVGPANAAGWPQAAPIRVWSVAQERAVRAFPPAGVSNAMFSPDGSRVLMLEGTSPNSPGFLVVGNVSTGRVVRLQAPPACVAQQAQFAFSADDEFVAAAAFCGVADVWNAGTGKLIRQVTQGGETSGVGLSFDGSRLLVSSWDSRATIWSVATGRALVQLVGHTSGINAAALSPDGSLVLTSGLDDTVRVWNADTGQELRLLTFSHYQRFLTFSPNGAQFAIGETVPIAGVADYAQVFDTCPGCGNPRVLLATARRLAGPPDLRTTLENTIIGRS